MRSHAVHRETGQALVEFTFAIIIFLVLLMAVFDVGRAIYMYNGVSEAARDIARTTSVYPGTPLGSSSQTAATIATQNAIIPGLSSPTFGCVNEAGQTKPGNGAGGCAPGSVVIVTIQAPYQPSTPLLGLLGTFILSSSASNQVQ